MTGICAIRALYALNDRSIRADVYSSKTTPAGGLLVTRVDHNGKVFSDQVRKQKVASILQINGQRVRGLLFYDPDGRLKDDLNNSNEAFIALTDAEFLAEDGAVVTRTKFLTINKNHIDWIMPAEDSDAAARRHS
jgi:hypothetical protein